MHRHRLIGLLAAAAALSLVTASSAAASSAPMGQIVYTHGNDLWIMNADGGTAQRPLITAAQAGAAQLYQPSLFANGGTSLAFVGETLAPDGNCEGNCSAIYTLVNGAYKRLDGPPENCGVGASECFLTHDSPSVMANGQILDEEEFGNETITCMNFCYEGANGDYQLESRSFGGSGTPAQWPIPITGQDAPSDLPFAVADPVDAGTIAYVGNSACSGGINPVCTVPLVIDTSVGGSPSAHGVSDDDVPQTSLAWSPDGSLLADVEGGNFPGIWVYPSTDVDTSNTITAYYIAADTPSTPFADVTFAGGGQLVFQVGGQDSYNLYSLPSSCWETPVTDPSSPKPACTLSQATKLTDDGTSQVRDGDPTWTSAAAPIPAFGQTPSCGCGNPPPPTTKLKLTITPASSQKVLKQKGLVASFECNVVCAFAAQGGVKIKGSKKLLLTKELSGSVAAGRAHKLSLKLSGSELNKIKTALKSHKKVTAEVEVAVKDQAGAKTQSSKQFTVKH
jgi:hypothetical protein